ncbi:MAG: dTDP-4-dehydrorhamnose 3,5-epimerase [Candidatus Doudnabacteria bacterium CG10_big_fil_rev_8_21_14_0_10_42_18]|uniref:dTDP-4-dehydrorhamnose 3,5-epimerase n=1 Tax=Candidatus Doudnabacteria bacterium CG10_big_fil_rev_8_21_14_0_10_42_18 TaxID=1974552 RepID=A0A2H0VCL2_9BACT|nr:MAG: dTDP-4-dehydrorhamnose 3,5-epimerase [Candidatus Doudnabacteria bacterium CG10_big_fil_rev_8_21_14_0_10_42_18]
MPFIFKKSSLPEVILVESKIFPDERGNFFEMHKKSDFEKVGIKEEFVQTSVSHSKKNVLRGLHFQKSPHGQAKLIMAASGRILDIAVDMRKSSPNFGKWVGEELSGSNSRMLYIPTGFAHGFLCLSDEAVVVYKMSREYSPESDAGVVWNDPRFGIGWPTKDPILSKKDATLPKFEKAFYFD